VWVAVRAVLHPPAQAVQLPVVTQIQAAQQEVRELLLLAARAELHQAVALVVLVAYLPAHPLQPALHPAEAAVAVRKTKRAQTVLMGRLRLLILLQAIR
jgi:hypothetical protein